MIDGTLALKGKKLAVNQPYMEQIEEQSPIG